MHITLWARALIAAAALSGVCASVGAATYYVSPCGQDFWVGLQNNCVAPFGAKRTVQAAINAATNGDTIAVNPGVYVGPIDLDGKAITIIGLAGPAATILDGGNTMRVVTCNSLEGPATLLQGLTIRNGYTTQDGAGMLVALASPTIVNCIFQDNRALRYGGGLAMIASSATVADCQFVSNRAGNLVDDVFEGWGAGLSISGGSPSIMDCEFAENRAEMSGGAAFITANASPDFSDCDFDDNSQHTYCSDDICATSMGSAVASRNSDVNFDNCAFEGNRAVHRGAAGIDNGSATFTACTFHDNQPWSANTDYYGGALFATGGADITLTACSFTENYSQDSAGAIFLNQSALTATLCGFSGNEADTVGGVIHSIQSSTNISGCTFVGNTAHTGGGAISTRQGTLDVGGSVFSSNTAVGAKGTNGGAILVHGGAIVADNCNFNGNESGIVGGAIYCIPYNGAGPAAEYAAVLTGCDFEDNSSYLGGGFGIAGMDALVTDCTFTSNFTPGGAAGAGAGMAVRGGAFARIVNTQFTGNSGTAVDGGGLGVEGDAHVIGCDFSGNSASDGGGASVLVDGDAYFVSCRFQGNTASSDGGAFVAKNGGSAVLANCVINGNGAPFNGGAVANHVNSLGSLTLSNCAVVSNTGGGVRNSEAGASVVVGNSIVRSNSSGSQLIGGPISVRYSNVQGGAAGPGNLNVDPQFVNAAVGNFRLQAGSPCIDAGSNLSTAQDSPDLDNDGNSVERLPLDFEGNPRITNNGAAADVGCGAAAIVDMGPFETPGVAGPELNPGDTNEDGLVDFDDITNVIANWGACAACCPADVSGNGAVDFDDLTLVLAYFGI